PQPLAPDRGRQLPPEMSRRTAPHLPPAGTASTPWPSGRQRAGGRARTRTAASPAAPAARPRPRRAPLRHAAPTGHPSPGSPPPEIPAPVERREGRRRIAAPPAQAGADRNLLLQVDRRAARETRGLSQGRRSAENQVLRSGRRVIAAAGQPEVAGRRKRQRVR